MFMYATLYWSKFSGGSKVKTNKTYGDKAFSVAALKLWNELPLDLRSLDYTWPSLLLSFLRSENGY